MEIGGAGLSPASLLPSANARASAGVEAVLPGWVARTYMGPGICGSNSAHSPNLKSTYLNLGNKERGRERKGERPFWKIHHMLSDSLIRQPPAANNGRTNERVESLHLYFGGEKKRGDRGGLPSLLSPSLADGGGKKWKPVKAA